MLVLELGDGITAIIEPTVSGVVPMSRDRGGKTEKLVNTLEQSIESIGRVAHKFQSAMQQHVTDAEEISIEFKVGFSTEAELIVISGRAEACATVTVTWKGK